MHIFTYGDWVRILGDSTSRTVDNIDSPLSRKRNKFQESTYISPSSLMTPQKECDAPDSTPTQEPESLKLESQRVKHPKSLGLAANLTPEVQQSGKLKSTSPLDVGIVVRKITSSSIVIQSSPTSPRAVEKDPPELMRASNVGFDPSANEGESGVFVNPASARS